MRASLVTSVALLSAFANGQSHGEGEEGSSMGPVAFLWPDDRHWHQDEDNIGPCGSAEGVTNRTEFPLSQGSVALSIADEAYHVAFRISFDNDPTEQDQFEKITGNVTELAPGHQCYKINQIEGKAPGENATIQMEYWAEFEGENDGKNQSFFACADVTFVLAKDFRDQVPCFNVTVDDFIAPTGTGTPGASQTGSAGGSSTAASGNQGNSSGGGGGSSGLSTGAKAGIAVGSIIGGLALIGGIGFFLWRRGKATGLQNKQSYELRANKLNAAEDASARSA